MPPIRPHSTAVNKTASWDGPKAMAAAPGEARILRYMSAWYSGQNADTKASYKFPHHEPRMNAPAVLSGVNNALARLSQAKIPAADRAGVEAHLRKHRKDAGLEESMTEDEIEATVDALIERGEILEDQRENLCAEISEVEMIARPVMSHPKTFAELNAEREAKKKMWTIQGNVDDWFTLNMRIWNDVFTPAAEKLEQSAALFEEFSTIMQELIAEQEVLSSNNIFETVELREIVVLDDEISENASAAINPRSPVQVKMSLLSPGWGNSKMKRYYPDETVKRDIHIFEGVKMYRNGHNLSERTEENEVGSIDKILGFSEKGEALAKVTIFDPDLAEKTRNRAASGKLDLLEVSILGRGDLREGKIDGKEAFIVDRITEAVSVDFVPKGGARGHGISLLSEEGNPMTKQKETNQAAPDSAADEAAQQAQTDAGNETQQAAQQQDNQDDKQPDEAAVQEDAWLSETDVSAYLEDSRKAQKLPASARKVIEAGAYRRLDDVKFMVDLQAAAVKEVSGTGAIPNLGEAETPGTSEDDAETVDILSEEEKQAEFESIFSKHGA